MTVLVDYAPVELALNAEQTYAFPWPTADAGAIEVYEIFGEAGVGKRYLVPVNDYRLDLVQSGPRSPGYTNGSVTFLRGHSGNTVGISLERNTLIDQTIDWPSGSPFNGRIMEYTLDKHMMICQELAIRKCQATSGGLIMHQTAAFTAYDNYDHGTLAKSVQKIIDILKAIDESALGCEHDLENT